MYIYIYIYRERERERYALGGARDDRDCGRRHVTIMFPLLDSCVSSLRRGHANMFCTVPI